MPVIAVCSGKGGVGKTTVSANLAAALTAFGETVVVDCDFMLPNLHILLAIENPGLSLFDVLRGDASLKDATYRLRMAVGRTLTTLHVIPSLASLSMLKEFEERRFGEVVEELSETYDYVVLDVSAGLSRLSLVSMGNADRAYVVVNPERSSVNSAKRVVTVARELGVEVGGVILNRYRGERSLAELVSEMLDSELAGIIRESRDISRSWDAGVPVISYRPRSAVSRDLVNLAMNVAGQKVNIRPFGRVRYLLGW
ncbi:MAG: AAA family ATPase [Archaeoglobi archaeon]|nr:AAA family ATPase [Archaeoglobi archaeon]